jgi:hypothetical protein
MFGFGKNSIGFEPADGMVAFFDLSKFAEQWLCCNNPEDSDCQE